MDDLRRILTLPYWDEVDDVTAARAVRTVERVVPGARLLELTWHSQGDQRHRGARFDVRGRTLALIPGAHAELGWDRATSLEAIRDAWPAAREELGRPQAAEMLGIVGSEPAPAELLAWLDAHLAPHRQVEVAPFLLEIEAEPFEPAEDAENEDEDAENEDEEDEDVENEDEDGDGDDAALDDPASAASALATVDAIVLDDHDVVANDQGAAANDQEAAADDDDDFEDLHTTIARGIASEGFRLPSPDEWEHAVRGGSRGLFRWGDHWPTDSHSYTGGPFGEHRRPSAFGIIPTADPYVGEVVSDPYQLRGGDGGEAVCGGAGNFASWLSFACAFVYDLRARDDYRDTCLDDARVRRALSIFPAPGDDQIRRYSGVDVADSALHADAFLAGLCERFPGLTLEDEDRDEVLEELHEIDRLRVAHAASPRIQILAALLLRKVGRVDAAQAAADAALAAERTWSTLTTVASVRRVRGDVDGALVALEEAFLLDPDDVSPLLDAADLLCQAGRLDDGVARYDRALAIEPDHGWAFPASRYWRYRRDGDPRWRIELTAFCERDPDNAAAAGMLAAIDRPPSA